MGNTQRMFLAIGASVIILIGYAFITGQFNEKTPEGQNTELTDATQDKTTKDVNEEDEAPVKKNETVEETPKEESNEVEELAEPEEAEALETKEEEQLAEYENPQDEQRAVLSNKLVIAEFSSKNAVLTSFKLRKHSKIPVGNKELVDIAEESMETLKPFYTTFDGFKNAIKDDGKLMYRLESRSSNKISFSAYTKRGGSIIKTLKTFTIDGYGIDMDVSFENVSEETAKFRYSVYLASSIGPYRPHEYRTRDNFRQIVYLPLGKGDRKEVLKEGEYKIKQIVDPIIWMAVENTYFVSFLIPPDNSYQIESMIMKNKLTKEDTENEDNFIASFRSKEMTLLPGQTSAVETYKSYMGPKNRDLLKSYNQSFEKVFHQKFLFIPLEGLIGGMAWFLKLLNKFTGHFALAIILLTVIYKAITFPLTQSSYDSMKKMQMLNPRIEEIKKQYSKHPEKMNQEIMNLYKKEGVNPIGGCLPMLLPFPILIGFLFLMRSMVELRNVSFLWLPDLTAPEALATLPFSIPFLGDQLNLLPFIMTAITVVSMQFTPQAATAATDNGKGNNMKIFNVIMPFFLFFIFYNFASGILLYWTVMNLLNFAQQFLTNKFKKEELKTQLKPAKKKKARG